MYPNDLNHSSGIFVHEQAQELKKQGHDVVVVSPVPYTPYVLSLFSKKWKTYFSQKHSLVKDQIQVHYPKYLAFPRKLFFSSSGTRMYLAIKKLVLKLHDKWDFDIIHAHVALPDGYAAMKISKKLGVPFVTTIHGQDFAFTIHRNKRCLKIVDQVMAQSQAVILVSSKLDNIRKDLFRNNRGDFYVIHNGISTLFLEKQTDQEEADIGEKRLVMLSVSNLIPLKGIDDNLRALQKLVDRFPELMYLVIGDGNAKEDLRKLVDELGVGDHVKFLGTKSRLEVKTYMESCDVFSLPSWNEAFGVVYIEAMACGKPVIGCEGQGVEDIVIPGETGLLVCPRDVNHLSEVLSILLKDPKLRTKIGEKARQRVQENFTWEHIAHNLSQLYYRVLQRDG